MEARIGVPEPHSIGTLGRDLGPDPDRDFWLDLDPYETNLDPKNCPLGSLLYIFHLASKLFVKLTLN